MVRYHNRISELKEDRLPRVAYEYEMTAGVKGWIEELRVITRLLHLPAPSLNSKYDMDNVQAAVLKLAQDRWWNEAQSKPKLATYVSFKDRDSPDTLVKSNLKRGIRSLLAKLVSGIFPLEVETGCYTSTPRDQRLCKVCNLNLVEDKCHFLFDCCAYQLERSAFYVNNVLDIIARTNARGRSAQSPTRQPKA